MLGSGPTYVSTALLSGAVYHDVCKLSKHQVHIQVSRTFHVAFESPSGVSRASVFGALLGLFLSTKRIED